AAALRPRGRNSRFGAARRRSCALGFRPERDGEVERASLADFAFDPDASAVHFHELFGDAEPQARSSELASDGRIDLSELSENILQLVLGNSDAGVRNTIDKVSPREVHPDFNTSLLGELDGVACEVHEALSE